MGTWTLRLYGLAVLISPAMVHGLDLPAEESDLSLAYGDAETVSIATGAVQPIARAPAVASVITAAQIKDMGATDLDQVLETVPGLHVAVSTRAYDPIYVIRGIYSESNPQVLVLVNGIPITNVFLGNRNDVWGGMPVNDISRIEVIRGPGSAVYGADAFAGVINIVTKDAGEIKGAEFGARIGSFQSKDAWALFGKDYGATKLAYSFEYGSTDGQDRTVEADAQTYLDSLLATHASLAPGPVNLGRKYIETRLDVSFHDWQVRVGYQGRWDVGTGAGIAQALDPAGTNSSNRINGDITYHFNDIRYWDTTVQLSYFDTSAISNLVLFPPQSYVGTFPNGVIGTPETYERHARLNLSTFYTGLERHRIRLGVGFNYSDLYKVKESRNFDIIPGGIPVPLGSLVDVSDVTAFAREKNRSDAYLFGQDEWQVANDWSLTGGLRYDDYSDFGQTINPRAALVWQMDYNLTSKLLYGRAFRAPSFAELYNQNNPVSLGNSDLKPETINTLELAFDYQPNDRVRIGMNLFHYHMHDIIRFLPDAAPATTISAQNAGGQTGNGLEWETNWSLSHDIKLYANYALQYSEDQTSRQDGGNAPHHEFYARLSSRIARDWLLEPQVTWVGERQRVAADPRPPLSSYTLVDITIRRLNIGNSFELAASVHNLFNSDAREPSLSAAFIPNDFPLAPRTFYVELSYKR